MVLLVTRETEHVVQGYLAGEYGEPKFHVRPGRVPDYGDG